MPTAKKAAKVVAAEGRPSRAQKKKIEEVEPDFEDEEVSAPKRAAKATSKATSAVAKASAVKNAKKRSRDSDNESDFEEEEAPKKKAKASAAAKKETETETVKPKKAAAKKSAPKKKEDESGDEGAAVDILPTNFAEPQLAPGELKIVSWNVAGYRAVLRKGFEQYLREESPDIVALQESKVPSDRDQSFAGYNTYFFGCEAKSGLHGTALFSKVKPIKVDFVQDYDREGRIIIAEYETFYLLNTYVPQSGQKLERLDFRIDWDKKLQALFLKLQQEKPVIWCGDLNVAKDPIDLANPGGNKRTAGFTQRERDSFNEFLQTNSLIDTYRKRNNDQKDCYTFWTYRHESRSKNIGWRMDYFIVSPALDNHVTHSYIRKHIHGSDHCPIVIHLKP